MENNAYPKGFFRPLQLPIPFRHHYSLTIFAKRLSPPFIPQTIKHLSLQNHYKFTRNFHLKAPKNLKLPLDGQNFVYRVVSVC